MIAGATNAGKTTLLRALANEIPPQERLITVERALELGLDTFPDLHPNVVAFEERLPNSEGQGAISMAELVRRSLRMNPSRVIVGEVLGDEIVTMLNAMSQGNDGSLSTIHANSSSEVFNRISTYALQATERLPIEASQMLIAGAVNFVVFIQRRNEYQSGGRLQRMVTSVREVNGVDGRVLSSEVFAETPDGRVTAHAPIACLEELMAYGYRPSGTWGEPMTTVPMTALSMTDVPVTEGPVTSAVPATTDLAALGSLGSMGGLFSTTVLYALASGVAVGGGLALFAVAVRGLPAKPEHEKQKASERANELLRFAGRRGSLAALVGLAVLLMTRWAVAGVAAAVLVFFWDRLFGGAGEERPPPCGAWRPSPPGRSPCATPSPARWAWNRPSRRPRGPQRPCCARTWTRWSTGCAPAPRCPRRCSSSPTRSTTRPPTSSSPPSSSTPGCAAQVCGRCSARWRSRHARRSTCASG